MSVVDEVKARLDIIDVISQTVELRKSGQSYTGFCPFHTNTKTPSFVIFPHTQSWRCFGACAEGGDLFSFVMKRDGVDFKEALTTLATLANIPLEQHQQAGDSEQDILKRKLFALNAEAALFYHNLLIQSPAGTLTQQYLAERTITLETISLFQLGYAPRQKDALKQHLLGRGYTSADMLTVGLLKEFDDGSPEGDRFRHRLMIPIRDKRGQVVGFGARALADKQLPKYLNSPQTILFDKSATLYGLDVARRHIYAQKEVVIVEGYMDVIQAHQQGAKNVVAQMGTAMTEGQLNQLTLGSPKIIIALDADAAGNKATIRSLSVARQTLPKQNRATTNATGITLEAHVAQDLFVVQLPEGKDPDDVLRQGLTAWQGLLQRALPALDFYEQLVLGQADIHSPQGKSDVVHALIPIYRDIADEIKKAARVQQLARTIGIDERLLMAELKTPSISKQQFPKKELLDIKKGTAHSKVETIGAEEHCLTLLVHYPKLLATVNDALIKQELIPLNSNDFSHGYDKEIFKFLKLWTASEAPTTDLLIELVGTDLEERLNFLIKRQQNLLTLPIERFHQDLQATVLQMRLQNVRKQIDELIFLQRNSDWQTRRDYTKMVSAYQQQRDKLDTALSEVRGSLVRTNTTHKKFTKFKD